MNTFFTFGVSVIVAGCSILVAHAAVIPKISLEQLGKTDKTVSYSVNADTGPDGISAAEVFLTVPVGVSLVSEDTGGSAFETEVTKAVQSGQQVHVVRASLTKNGIISRKAHVTTLTFSAPASPNNLPTVVEATSKMIRYSDSADVLHASPSPTIVAKKTQTHPYVLPIAVGALAILGAALFAKNRRNSSR